MKGERGREEGGGREEASVLPWLPGAGRVGNGAQDTWLIKVKSRGSRQQGESLLRAEGACSSLGGEAKSKAENEEEGEAHGTQLLGPPSGGVGPCGDQG